MAGFGNPIQQQQTAQALRQQPTIGGGQVARSQLQPTQYGQGVQDPYGQQQKSDGFSDLLDMGKKGYDMWNTPALSQPTQAFGEGAGMYPVSSATPAVGSTAAPASGGAAGGMGAAGMGALIAAGLAGTGELHSKLDDPDKSFSYGNMNDKTTMGVGGKDIGLRAGDWAQGVNPMAWVKDPKSSAKALTNALTLGIFD